MHSIPSSSSATLESFPLQFGLEHERRRLIWPPARRCSSSPPACGCTSKATRVTGVAVGYEVLTRAPVQLAMDASTCARVHGQLPRRARNLVPADGPAVGWPFSCPVKPALAAAARYDTSWRPYGCFPRPERARAVLEGSGDDVASSADEPAGVLHRTPGVRRTWASGLRLRHGADGIQLSARARLDLFLLFLLSS